MSSPPAEGTQTVHRLIGTLENEAAPFLVSRTGLPCEDLAARELTLSEAPRSGGGNYAI